MPFSSVVRADAARQRWWRNWHDVQATTVCPQFAIQYAAHVFHLSIDLIRVNLDDSFDAKDLLGTYVCTDTPGEFRWQYGALTKAAMEGRWILIEDINLASFDVLSMLVPILESSQMRVPGMDEAIPLSDGFTLFTTETIDGPAHRGPLLSIVDCSFISLDFLFSGTEVPTDKYWWPVQIQALPPAELSTLILQQFASLAPIAPKLLCECEDVLVTSVFHVPLQRHSPSCVP